MEVKYTLLTISCRLEVVVMGSLGHSCCIFRVRSIIDWFVAVWARVECGRLQILGVPQHHPKMYGKFSFLIRF